MVILRRIERIVKEMPIPVFTKMRLLTDLNKLVLWCAELLHL